jgi:hypothetical protein
MALVTTDRPAPKVKCTVRLPADLADTIDIEAAHRGVTFSELVRSTLASGLFGVTRRGEVRRAPCSR